MKASTLTNLSFFEEESKGLESLRKTGTIGVPRVLGIGTDEARITTTMPHSRFSVP